ncbi:MAG: hypothetical protein EBV16_09010 [Betaproteobacteria bacterium]|nr:hypothetical protein [Betaproteobacteria bacterium]
MAMTRLAMTWEAWGKADAVALSEGLHRGDYSARELAKQAAAAIQNVNPSLDAVREIFSDVIEDPLIDGMNPSGFFRGVPFVMKDLGPGLKGRLQEMGSRFMQGNSEEAIRLQEKALTKATYTTLKEELQVTLDSYKKGILPKISEDTPIESPK